MPNYSPVAAHGSQGPTPPPSPREDDEEVDPCEETLHRGRPRERRGHPESPRIQDTGERHPAATLEGRRIAQGSADHDFDTTENDAADAAHLPRAEEPARIELFPEEEWTQPYVQSSQQSGAPAQD